jgi:peptidoglycan/LPS O-acetylase OafA/YrhL
VFAALSPKCFLYRTKSRVFSWLALLAYAMYLTHKQIIHIIKEFLSDSYIDENSLFLICFIASILGAFLLYFLVELPFLKLRGKILNKE